MTNAHDARQLEPDQLSRMLKKEIGQAAELLIKVQHDKAGAYAVRMAELAEKDGREEDFAYWKRIAEEVEKRLTASKYDD